jgi:sarcosine oxidase subunit alpha
MYGEDLLVVGPEGAEILTARTLVLACGAHDGALAFEGNDVPGIMSARAAGWLLAGGILVGRNVVIVIPPGGGPFGESFAVALKASTTGIAVEVVFGEPVRALGTSHVRGIVVRDAIGDEHEYTADVVVLDAPRSAAFELAEQAGAKLRASSHGFAVITTRGKIGPNRFAVGEMTGAPLDALAVEAEADTVAQTIAEEKNAGQP